MNIWIINQYAITPDQSGGARHFSLGRALAQRGHQVAIIASAFNHHTRQEKDSIPRDQRCAWEQIEGVRFCRVKSPSYAEAPVGRLWSMFSFAHRVRRTRFEEVTGVPDVIVGSSPHLPGADTALAHARRLGRPFVLEVRDLWPLSVVDLGKVSARHPLVWFLGKLERRLYRSASETITLLPYAEKHIRSVEPAAGPVTWIPNGIQVEVGAAPSPDSAEPFTLAYCGSHGLANGLEAILDGAARVRRSSIPIRFDFVGDGPQKAALVARARREGLDNVAFHPPIPKSAVHSWLTARSACVLNIKDSPLYRYGVSLNKIFDYMLSGRPTIIASGAANNPIAESNGGLCVPADDGAAIADATARLARMSPDERHAMGTRGRNYVLEHHSIEALANRFEGLLHRVVFSRGASPQTGNGNG